MFLRLLIVLATLSVILGAGWLALRRPDIPMERLEQAYANSDSRFLVLENEGRLHLRDVGPRDAPAIVLVHGFSASLHTWEPWVADLAKDYRVVSLDLPGHGLSGCIDNSKIGTQQFVDAVDAVVRALKIERFTLAGNSMGGHTAWAYALAHPQKLDGLILVDAAGWPADADDQKDSPIVFKLLANPVARSIMKDLDMSALVRSGLEDSFTDQTLVTEAMVERYTSLGRAPCHRDAIITMSSTREGRIAASNETLAAITTPTLILHGEDDNLIPASHGKKFDEAIPDSDLKLYPGVGHLPQEEAVEDSLADVRAFLTRVAAKADIASTETVPAPQP